MINEIWSDFMFLKVVFSSLFMKIGGSVLFTWGPMAIERGRIGRDRPSAGLFPCLCRRGEVETCREKGEWIFKHFLTRLFTFRTQGGLKQTNSNTVTTKSYLLLL